MPHPVLSGASPVTVLGRNLAVPLFCKQHPCPTAGEGDDDLCCFLKHVYLEAAETSKYEALSYRWEESPEQARNTWIDNRTFVISHSLYVAMSALRDSKLPRRLWIDAISIKQVSENDSDNEKMVQISLMGKIYRGAHKVIIWLGPAADSSDTILEIIADCDVERMQGSGFADGFTKLSLRSWFFRTWIIQEFVLATFSPIMVCGTKSITSGQFLAVHAFLDALERRAGKVKVKQGWKTTDLVSFRMEPIRMETSPIAALADLRSAALDREGHLRRRSLAAILQYYRQSDVMNARDKIYGALGLVDESVHDFIRAESNKSISQTYTDTMAYMFNTDAEKHDIEILELFLAYPCSLALPEPISDMPSWVPDFSRKHAALLDYTSKYKWFWLYQITRTDGRKAVSTNQHGGHHVTVNHIDRSLFKICDKALFAKGLLVDEITAVVPSAFYQDFAKDVMPVLDKKLGQQLQPALDRLYSNSETITLNEVTNDL